MALKKVDGSGRFKYDEESSYMTYLREIIQI